jgi:uncharacterized RDD family membrane protein YckC
MTCSYCGSRNGDGEHRCQRCGRRPSDTLTNAYHTDGALATKPQPVVQIEPRELARTSSPPNFSGAIQRSLFQPERPASNVIPFESFSAPPPPKPRAKATGPAKTGEKANSRRASKTHEGQGTLDFLPPAPVKPRTLGTTVDSVIYCEAPVATSLHRAVAAALDWGVVLAAYGMFLATYFFCGGRFTIDKLNLIVFGAALVLIAVTYGLLWAVANRETAGMRCVHLRLTTFDGFRPDLRQRMARFAGSCLSLCTVVGLLWSLADEESLAWQDHISGTFPTPRTVDAQIFRRR